MKHPCRCGPCGPNNADRLDNQQNNTDNIKTGGSASHNTPHHMADYIPANDDEFRSWIVTFLAKLPTFGAAVGITAPEQSALTSLGNATTGSIDNLSLKKNEYDSALANRTESRGLFLLSLRPIVRRAKTSANYTNTIGEALGVVSPNTPVDPATIQPSFNITTQRNSVRLRIKREGAQSTNVYTRKVGQMDWLFLARVNLSLFEDSRPLSQPGVPEVREYMVRGVIGDEEVGLPSETRTVVFAGEMAA